MKIVPLERKSVQDGSSVLVKLLNFFFPFVIFSGNALFFSDFGELELVNLASDCSK